MPTNDQSTFLEAWTSSQMSRSLKKDKDVITSSLQSHEDIDKQETTIAPKSREHVSLQDNHKVEENVSQSFPNQQVTN